MREYYVYMLRCSDNSYYTGVTNNVEMRLEQHQGGGDSTCYTYKRRPVELVHVERFNDVWEALRREKQIKPWSRKKKEALIQRDSELLQIYSKKKKKCQNEAVALPKLGVDVIISGVDGTILLVQRRDDDSWSMPGGWVEEGETPDQAAMREVLEETGLHVKLASIADVHIRKTGSVHITYHASRVGGGLLRQSSEASRIAYLTMGEVKRWHADHRVRVRRSLDTPPPRPAASIGGYSG